MILPSYHKWIVLSMSDYVQKYVGSNEYIWFQGMVRPKDMPSQRYEVRYLGPDAISQLADQDTIHLTINCQVATVKVANNIENHLVRVGKIWAGLSQCISVYRMGSDPILDNMTLFGHLQQISDVQVTSFGTVDPVSSVERSTVEATYKVVI